MSKLAIVFTVVFAVLAYIFGKNPIKTRHLLVQLTHGRLVPALDSSCGYDSVPKADASKSSRFGVDKHCFNSTGGFFWYDAEHNVEKTRAILEERIAAKCPVLIHRPFKSDQCLSKLRDLAERDNLSVRVRENHAIGHNIIFPEASHEDRMGTKEGVQMPIKDLFAEYDQGYSNKFTAFDLTLRGKEYQDIWDMDVDWMQGRAGSTFFSNYNQTFVTTPFHAALSLSFGYQCAGTKTWYMLTPDDMLATTRYQGYQTYMKDCNHREDLKELIFKTRSDPDTMFFFPPFWAHAVETTKGLSVLLNYRSIRMGYLLKNDFVYGLTIGASLFNLAAFFSTWDSEEIIYYFIKGKMPKIEGTSVDRVAEASQNAGPIGKLANIIKNVLRKVD